MLSSYIVKSEFVGNRAMTMNKKPGYYARLICEYLQDQPDMFVDDPKKVQSALGLSDAEFQKGITYCLDKRIIKLESAAPVAVASPAKASPFSTVLDDDDDDNMVFGSREPKSNPFSSSPFSSDPESSAMADTGSRLSAMLRSGAMVGAEA
jgi:hypothetical protein